MKRIVIITSIIVVVSLTALMVFLRLTSPDDKSSRFAEVQRGYFEISVSSPGEIVAENSTDIRGPNIVNNRNFRSTPLKIIDLVPEGTIVKQGDYIGSLDKSSFVNTLRDEQETLRVAKDQYAMKLLDTSVALSQLRDDTRNQYFAAEEAKITVAQSKYEPPATQRQAEIQFDKASRSFAQKKKQYALKVSQLRAELRTLKTKIGNQQRKVDDLNAILEAFTIRAPADGMVIYKKDRMGKKITAGTTLNPWDPVVATLPDLSSLLSKIYISEIDINKLSLGLPVEISIDAFPEKHFNGQIYQMANIGEQLANSDSKVFEVLVSIDRNDPLLRPSMTTNNKVIINSFYDVTYVPSESVHAGTDSIPFVYTKDRKKQVVILGKSNDKYIIVEKGLDPGTNVWLNVPEKAEKFVLAGANLIPEIKERNIIGAYGSGTPVPTGSYSVN